MAKTHSEFWKCKSLGVVDEMYIWIPNATVVGSDTVSDNTAFLSEADISRPEVTNSEHNEILAAN